MVLDKILNYISIHEDPLLHTFERPSTYLCTAITAISIPIVCSTLYPSQPQQTNDIKQQTVYQNKAPPQQKEKDKKKPPNYQSKLSQ